VTADSSKRACCWNLAFLFQFTKKDGKTLFYGLDFKALAVAGINFLSCETVYQKGVLFGMLPRLFEVMPTETKNDLVGIETHHR